MKALTIKQPWLWCITDATKRVENRTWKPPFAMIGQRIALHAAKSHTKEDWLNAQDTLTVAQVPRPGTSQELIPLGAIVATALIVGYVVVESRHGMTPRMVEVSSNAINYNHRLDPWFFGPVGWLFGDVQKLAKPIPCKGALGLWTVPEEIETIMNEVA